MTEYDLDSIGGRLKKLLADRNMSISELARRVRASQSSISFLIAGKTRTTSKLAEIARVLDADIAGLATGQPNQDRATSGLDRELMRYVITQSLPGLLQGGLTPAQVADVLIGLHDSWRGNGAEAVTASKTES